MTEVITFVCPGCGKTVTARRRPGKSAYFCNMGCYVAARTSGAWRQPRTTAPNAPGSLPHKDAMIRITADIDLYRDFKPQKGKIYKAERYDGPGMMGYVITVNGHRVNIRWDECEEV